MLTQTEMYERINAAKKQGKLLGNALDKLVYGMEKAEVFNVCPASEDYDTLDTILEVLMDSYHMKGRYDDYREASIFKAAARVAFSVDLKAAERDLRFAERAYEEAWEDEREQAKLDELHVARSE